MFGLGQGVHVTLGWGARLTVKRGVLTYDADAEVAQLVEQRTENPCVASSNLALGTITHPRRTM